MSARAQIDISAKITGYQDTLNKLRQAIDQLNPGASISKSLETAFKNAENYINKLAKTPIVQVGSDKQLQSLITTLDKATSLVTNVADKLGTITLDDINADILKEALKDVNKQLSQTTDKLNQVANGPQLSTLSGKVKNLESVFTGLGKNIDQLGAVEGVKILNDALEDSKKHANEAKDALDAVQKKIDAWQPPDDKTGLFGSKSGGKGTKLLKELDTSQVFKNIDFNKAGFSQEAIEKLKQNLTQQLTASLEGKMDDELAEKIQVALNSAFTNGLKASNLSTQVNQFANQIREILGKKAGQIGDIYQLIFGGGTRTQTGGTKIAEDLLRRVTIEMNSGAQRLRQIIEVVSNANLAQDKPLIKLVEEGQLQTVKKQLEDILHAAKQAYQQMRNLPKDLIDERNDARNRLVAANKETNQLTTIQNNIINSSQYQAAITQIQEFKTQIIDLKARIAQLENTHVQKIHQVGDNVREAGENFKITSQEAEQYRNKLDEIASKEKLLGKIQGVVERWFSIYAAVRLVSNAIKSMISTVQQLDKTITNIAIVTNMSQNDLWQQMPTYTKTAREFAASISGVYEVSQLYYQQGKLNI